MAQLKDTTITGGLSVSGTVNITGATQTNNDVTLYKSTGDSPSIIFQRGTLGDTLNDYKITDVGGYLKVKQQGNSSTSGFTQVAELTNQGTFTVSTPPATDTTPSVTAWISPTDSSVKISTDATIASGDKLVIRDSSDSNKMRSSSISFGTSTSTYLRNDGTWGTPSGGGGGVTPSDIVIKGYDDTGETTLYTGNLGSGLAVIEPLVLDDSSVPELAIQHQNSGVTAGTYVPSASAKDNTLNLPSFTIDAQGHVTAASNYGYTMTTPTLSHATNSQTYNRNVGGLYYDEYGTIYYRTPFAVTPILNYGSGNDGKSPSSSGHGNPLGYSFFVLTAGQTSMTVKVYDSTYVLSNFGQGWSKFIVTDVVARDAVTKEPVILGWSATEGVDETDIYDDAMTKVSTVTITIGQAYTNNIEFEILYHRIPAAVM